MTAQAETVPRSAPRISHAALLAMTLAAAFVVYAGTLGFDFVHDDHEQIVENFRLKSWQFLPGYFTEHVWSHISPRDSGSYYRPAFLLWLRLVYVLFGANPWGWHFTTVSLHVAATLLVYLLARRLLTDPGGALLAALIFGLHPAHLEAVAWVSGLTEPLLAVFFISSFLCFLKRGEEGRHRRAWSTAALGLYTLALLTKETAIILPILLLAWEWMAGGEVSPDSAPRSWRERLRPIARALAPYAGLSAAYLVARFAVLKQVSYAVTPLPFRTLVFTAPAAVWFYFRRLVWPAGVSPFYDLPYVTEFNRIGLLLPASAVLAVAGALVGWTRKSRDGRTIAFAFVWIIVPLLPVLNFSAFAEGDIVHDRYLYLPSAGFAILAAIALRQLKAGRRHALGRAEVQGAFVVVLAVALGWGTAYQSLNWADDLLLAYHGLRVAPNSPYANNILANALAQRGSMGEAIQFYHKALALKPNLWVAYYNMALVYYKTGRVEEAARAYRQAIQVNPFDPREFVGLGFTELQLGRLDDAATSMRHAIDLRSDDSSAHMALGVVLKAQGNLAGALDEFKTAARLEPQRASARQQILEIEARLRGSASGAAPQSGNANTPSPPPTR